MVCNWGYNDYSWYKSLIERRISCVTWQRNNAVIRALNAVQSLPVPQSPVIWPFATTPCVPTKSSCRMFGKPSAGMLEHNVNIPLSQSTLDYLQRPLLMSINSVSRLNCFLIESKQNPKIKLFLGTSKNTVMMQTCVAMCVYWLLTFVKFSNQVEATLQQILMLLVFNLFAKRDLIKIEPPPDNHQHVQEAL